MDINNEKELIINIRNKIPKITCPWDNCSDCCVGCSPWSYWEMISLEDKMILDLTPEGHCPYLINERCSVYDNRPIICRLYGINGGDSKYSCIHNVSPLPIIDNKPYSLTTEKKIVKEYLNLIVVGNGMYYPNYDTKKFVLVKNSTDLMFLQRKNSQLASSIVGIKKRFL
jgi:Fe-S-cluster containining protein